MSGSTPFRLGSMLRVGSPVGDDPPSSASRPTPTCCQQNALTLAASDGLKPVHGCFGAACLTPLETKIWSCSPEPATLPSSSSHATHGTGSAPATAAPPATDGFSASLPVWMLSDGMPAPRSWPSGCHWFAAATKRLAKIWFSPPSGALGSYQASHGTVRPAPAKSIEGASASAPGSMLSDGPCVTQRPFLKARTKICCELPDACSNVVHGTRGPPAASEPPTMSETPGVLAGVDAGGRVVVHLRAVGRQAGDRSRAAGRDECGAGPCQRRAPENSSPHGHLLNGHGALRDPDARPVASRVGPRDTLLWIALTTPSGWRHSAVRETLPQRPHVVAPAGPEPPASPLRPLRVRGYDDHRSERHPERRQHDPAARLRRLPDPAGGHRRGRAAGARRRLPPHRHRRDVRATRRASATASPARTSTARTSSSRASSTTASTSPTPRAARSRPRSRSSASTTSTCS